ncbi:MAG: membrane dipeptidase [Sandaracinus sp.]
MHPTDSTSAPVTAAPAGTRASSWLAWGAYPATLVACVALGLALFDAGAGAPLATTAAYVLAIVATLGLERLQPKREAWSPSRVRETLPDLPYVASGVIVQRVVGGAVIAGVSAASLALASRIGPWEGALSMPWRAGIALLAADLGKYAVHRVSHERAWLWPFHASHHAPDRMYALNALRLHPVNVAWNVALEVGFAAALGLDARALTIVGSFRAAVAVLQHANVEMRFGWVNRILSTPEVHLFHHSAERSEADANYGATFSFWDVLFGTFVSPRERALPARLGLADGGVEPRRFVHQLVWPWCAARRAACSLVRGWEPDPASAREKQARAVAPWARATALAVSVAAVVALVVFGVLPAEVDAASNGTLLPPPYRPSARAAALHRRLFVADLHADTLLWDRDLLARGRRGHVDVPRLVEGNVALEAFTIPTASPLGRNIDRNADRFDTVTALVFAQRWPVPSWAHRSARVLYAASRLHAAADRSAGRLVVIERAADLDAFVARRAAEPGLVAGMLGVEGAHALEGDPGALDRFVAAGVRMMSFTHFFDDAYGGSAHGEGRIGLTPAGRALLAQMEERHVLVDLAHASPRTIDDVLASATRPVVVSHTGVRATCDTARNLDDRQLRAIAAQGGLVGIGFFPHAVCGSDVEAIARAVRHAVDVMGAEHVALGSDFDGATPTAVDASGMALVTEALLARGLSEDEVAAVMGENAQRMLRASLP